MMSTSKKRWVGSNNNKHRKHTRKTMICMAGHREYNVPNSEVLLKGHPYFKKLLEKEGGGNPSTTPDHPSEESSAIPSGALVSVVVGDRRRESTMPRSLEPYQAAFNSTLFSGTDSCLVDELFVRFFASHRTVDNSFAGN
nr:hypothetical protein Iba_chr14fCG11410 [Ipomoea batatas]